MSKEDSSKAAKLRIAKKIEEICKELKPVLKQREERGKGPIKFVCYGSVDIEESLW